MKFRKQLFVVCLAALFSLNAIAQGPETTPIADYLEAGNLSRAGKNKEAKEVLERLMEKFPEDYSIYNQYWREVEKISGTAARNESIKKAFPLFEKVSLEKRTEAFYATYLIGMYYAGEQNKYVATIREALTKFPKGKSLAFYKYNLAEKEEDPVEVAKLWESFLADNEEDIRAVNAAYELFKLKSERADMFDRESLVKLAEKADTLSYRRAEGANPTERKRETTYYPWGILNVAKGLKDSHPELSVKYALKGLKYATENRDKYDFHEFYITMLQELLMDTYVAQGKWNEAKTIGGDLFKMLQKPDIQTEINEAMVRLNYAKACEGINDIPEARKQFLFASKINPAYRKHIDAFNLKHRLSESEYRPIEESVSKEFETTSQQRDKFNKDKLLKTLISQKAGDVQIKDINGKVATLKDYKGKVLFLGFWATWCAPCIKELEEVKVAAQKYADNQNIAFAFVCDDGVEGTNILEKFVKKKGYNFPVFYGNPGARKDYGVRSFPTLLVIDQEGNIRFRHVGYINDGYYLKRLDWMIEAVNKK